MGGAVGPRVWNVEWENGKLDSLMDEPEEGFPLRSRDLELQVLTQLGVLVVVLRLNEVVRRPRKKRH